MTKNNGWVKLHRKLADNELWLSEPFTRGQAWIDLLLLANHKTGFIRRRGIMVKVERGQVGYSEEALSKRWRWSKGKLRRFFCELAGRSMISRQNAEITVPKNDLKNQPKTVLKKTSVSALIYIENYDRYQANGTEDSTEECTENGTGTRSNKKIRKKNPPAFSENEIPEMMNRYPDPETIDRAFQAISSTRKTGKIADSVKLGILKAWAKYPTEQVLAGIKTFIDKGYAAQGKGEKYLAGIIKNTRPEPPKPEKIMPDWF